MTTLTVLKHSITFEHNAALGVRSLCRLGDYTGPWRDNQSQAAADYAAHITQSDPPATTGPGPRVWRLPDLPGPEVKTLRSVHGTLYDRFGTDDWRRRVGRKTSYRWHELLRWGPLTDATEYPAWCGRCSTNPPARPGETHADNTPSLRSLFCGSCIDRCHEATDYGHVCPICAGGPTRSLRVVEVGVELHGAPHTSIRRVDSGEPT